MSRMIAQLIVVLGYVDNKMENKKIIITGILVLLVVVQLVAAANYFIPTGTTKDWEAFKANKPDDVRIVAVSLCKDKEKGDVVDCGVCDEEGNWLTANRGNECSDCIWGSRQGTFLNSGYKYCKVPSGLYAIGAIKCSRYWLGWKDVDFDFDLDCPSDSTDSDDDGDPDPDCDESCGANDCDVINLCGVPTPCSDGCTSDMPDVPTSCDPCGAPCGHPGCACKTLAECNPVIEVIFTPVLHR